MARRNQLHHPCQRKARQDERAASGHRGVGQRCGLLLWLLGRSLPGHVGESAPAGSYGANSAAGRLPGGAGALLVPPGARLDDAGGGGVLAGPLLPRTLVRRGASAAISGEVRPARVRARIGPGQSEKFVRAARWESRPDRVSHTGCGYFDLYTGVYLPYADLWVVLVLDRSR